MRPNSRAHDPFAPHRGTGPAPVASRPSRRRGGRRKRTQQAPVQGPERRVAEPVAIERTSAAEPEVSEQVAEGE